MEPFKRILVDIDATARSQPALERAVRLARSSGATLTIVDVVAVPSHARRYLPAGLEEELARARQEELARVASGVTDVPVRSKLLAGRAATVLVQEVLRSDHDLLMRSHAREQAVRGPRPFGAVDMELLRTCPCPVLLVRHGSPAPHPRIAAAVNASTEDEKERSLNGKIVQLAALMASHLDAGAPVVMEAWTAFAENNARLHATDEHFAAYVEQAGHRASAALTEFVDAFGSPALQSALRRGEPEDVIPEFVVAEGIDIVVMGTVARAGIAGMLIGNTAERILRKLPCSVLTVKPDGFESPVRV
jgi:nucleotide-binding universal stress UspA family protein